MTRIFATALAALCVASPAHDSVLPTVAANDNRVPAGTLRDGVLTVRLVVGMARWYPEADDGPWVDVAAFSEADGPPRIPGPLIRVPAGTTILAIIRNAFADSTLWLQGFVPRPIDALDSIAIPPGEVRTLRFAAGEPGTYLYRATLGTVDTAAREREQLIGAFVVDSALPPARARTDDRVFVLNIWGEPQDSVTYRQALAINGKSWPYTERLAATVGDSLRWRVINGSMRNHPMHLHGFYYRVHARGDFRRDTAYAPSAQRLVVTEDLSPGHTMALVWRPERAGNWLFHCHIGFHVVPETRLAPPAPGSHDGHDVDPGKHMAGLVLGIIARDSGAAAAARGPARRLQLYVNEGRKRGRAPRALSFVLQRGAPPPAADSVEIPGTTLILERGRPTDITVVNRLREATAVHWHGIELESYSDGVAGWSGLGSRLAPVIAPGDSFTARLTLPRAGTFIYHTHLNDIEQITSGLYGAIVVLPPGERFDGRRDHVFVVGWDGDVAPPPRLLVNGDSLPPPLELARGVAHRLRFVNIGPAQRVVFALRHDTVLATWRPLAKDGADLPPAQAGPRLAAQRMGVGETYDVEFSPPAPGEYVLTMGIPRGSPAWRRRIIVR